MTHITSLLAKEGRVGGGGTPKEKQLHHVDFVPTKQIFQMMVKGHIK